MGIKYLSVRFAYTYVHISIYIYPSFIAFFQAYNPPFFVGVLLWGKGEFCLALIGPPIDPPLLDIQNSRGPSDQPPWKGNKGFS